MKSMRVVAVAAVLLTSFLATGPAAAQMVDKKAMSLEAARRIAASAEAEAVRNKWNVVIAIVDDGGQLLYLQRMDGAQYGSIDVAIQKARTSAAFRRPTKVFEDAIAGGRTAILSLDQALALEGGLPIVHNGQVVGAIGVSGVTSQQDGQIAKAGTEALTAQ
jgi:uncharacterized protein GlcG (DUF336 family)